MEVVYERCAGLDVHKTSVPAAGGGWRKETRRFGTVTAELPKLADWLRAGEVTALAMESTGVYWKPVFNFLESEFEVLVVNARHIKYVPGRKSDISDAQWIAELLQDGLLKASLDYPARFDSLAEAQVRARGFFYWYNNEHRHSSLGLMTPATVHYGRAASLTARRQATLTAAYEAHAERFVKGSPQPPELPQVV